MMLRRYHMLVVLMLSLVLPLFACEMEFRLSGPAMTDMRILPGSTIALEKGASYTLQVIFSEDHHNCKIPPEDTLFMLDKQKWRVGKTEQGVVLTSPIVWETTTKSTNVTSIAFVASNIGQRVLDICRTCTKGGYDEFILFSVT
ncbi:MAG: hypothetical protein WBI82_09150 [Sphaerochaeta sp.]